MNPKEMMQAIGEKFFVKRPQVYSQGYDAFVRVSGRYPTCIWAQAAGISLYCQENSLDPATIGRSLYNNSNEIDAIRRLAKKAHKIHKKGPKPPPFQHTKELINVSFSVAGALSVLPQSAVEDFGRLYDSLKADGMSVRNIDLAVERAESRALGFQLFVKDNYPQVEDSAPKL